MYSAINSTICTFCLSSILTYKSEYGYVYVCVSLKEKGTTQLQLVPKVKLCTDNRHCQMFKIVVTFLCAEGTMVSY